MRHVVKLPRVGDTVTDVVVLDWYVTPDSRVAAGEPLLRVETDKVEIDIPAPVSGVLREQLVAEGDEVTVGAVLGVLEN